MLNIPATTRQFFFSHARTALKYGLISLGMKAGDEILIPDFICDVVLHPIDQLGIKVTYYSLKDDLTPEWNELQKLVNDKTKAILMVHFFGQPQNIYAFDSFCKENGLFLIEDNAHGHGGEFEGRLLGTFGDIGVASPRKFHNLMSGGLLFLNLERLSSPDVSGLPVFSVSIFQEYSRILARWFPGLKRFLKKLFMGRPLFEDPYSFREQPVNDYCIDKTSLNDYIDIDWIKMAVIKRKNYLSWKFFLDKKGIAPVFDDVHFGSSPQCFPVYVKNKAAALEYFNWGWRNGYHVYSWPTLPDEIIKRNDHVLKRWEILICFSTDRKAP